jgi:hypothetical protein
MESDTETTNDAADNKNTKNNLKQTADADVTIDNHSAAYSDKIITELDANNTTTFTNISQNIKLFSNSSEKGYTLHDVKFNIEDNTPKNADTTNGESSNQQPKVFKLVLNLKDAYSDPIQITKKNVDGTENIKTIRLIDKGKLLQTLDINNLMSDSTQKGGRPPKRARRQNKTQKRQKQKKRA